MEWDDLRIFLAVAKAGSLAGAARSLGVNHSTVFRRVNGFEDKLGVRVFERLPSGYVLTAAGEEMRASALRVEAEIDRLDRRVSGQDLRLSGPLAVTTTDTLSSYVLGPHLKSFKDLYPGILLELQLNTQFVNLSKRQADVAVRVTNSRPETLVGRRLCGVAFAGYASEDYLKTVEAPDNLEALTWLGLDESLAHLASHKWQRNRLPNATVAMTVNNLFGLLTGTRYGIGAALMPCFMGDAESALRRITEPLPEAGSSIWILTHEDLRHTARVRAFMDHVAAGIIGDADALEGRRPKG